MFCPFRKTLRKHLQPRDAEILIVRETALKAVRKSFRFDSRLRYVADVASATRRICEEHSVSKERAVAIELALVESVNNAIVHAYQGKPGHTVTVEIDLSESVIHVAVTDDGICMAKEPPGTLPPADQVNGRGWFLIRHCMDEVWYESCEGENTLYMSCYLT